VGHHSTERYRLSSDRSSHQQFSIWNPWERLSPGSHVLALRNGEVASSSRQVGMPYVHFTALLPTGSCFQG